MGLIEQVNAEVIRVESIQQEQASQQKSRESVPPVPTFSGTHSNNHKLSKPTKLPYFSGSEPVPKDECGFEQWLFQVQAACNLYAEEAVRTGIIATLRGGASELVNFIGFNSDLQIIIDKMEGGVTALGLLIR